MGEYVCVARIARSSKRLDTIYTVDDTWQLTLVLPTSLFSNITSSSNDQTPRSNGQLKYQHTVRTEHMFNAGL